MVADKKRMNHEAIAVIQQVNSEVAGNSGSLSRNPQIETGRKGSEQIKNAEFSRDYVATSLFDWRQSNEELQRSQKESHKESQKESQANQENLNLRSGSTKRSGKTTNFTSTSPRLQSQNSNLRSSRVSPAQHSLLKENRALREQIHFLQTQQGGNLHLQLQKWKYENSHLRSEIIALLKNK